MEPVNIDLELRPDNCSSSLLLSLENSDFCLSEEDIVTFYVISVSWSLRFIPYNKCTAVTRLIRVKMH